MSFGFDDLHKTAEILLCKAEAAPLEEFRLSKEEQAQYYVDKLRPMQLDDAGLHLAAPKPKYQPLRLRVQPQCADP